MGGGCSGRDRPRDLSSRTGRCRWVPTSIRCAQRVSCCQSVSEHTGRANRIFQSVFHRCRVGCGERQPDLCVAFVWCSDVTECCVWWLRKRLHSGICGKSVAMRNEAEGVFGVCSDNAESSDE
uniref:Uncharacterized protein n=1 Tax=Cacopsylla melanoneura TaxID=428564 RepID=A0A8D8RJ86_9HEMI